MQMLLEKVQITYLKKLVKLKLPLYNPHASLYSTNLVGVPDPTGTLEEGEVFVSLKYSISYKSNDPRNGILSDGDIVVSRYPMGHWGDIRKLKHRLTPELEAFVGDRKGSTIFFSTKGSISAADMMGGGDFDGDTFLIIYGNNTIVQSFTETFPFEYGVSVDIKKDTDNFAVIKSLTAQAEIGIYANKRKACKY
jgi:hypothetical protein